MVLFQNLSLHQEVEVLHYGQMFAAKVRYLGSLALRRGDWVGLELFQPVGDTDGMHRARRYFFVRQDFGMFTTADRLRFKHLKRHVKNSYRQLDKVSAVDTELFADWTRSEEPYYLKESNKEKEKFYLSKPKSYHLNHNVGNRIPSVAMLKAKKSQRSSATNRGLQYGNTDDFFITPPSVPQDHIPADVLRTELKRRCSTSLLLHPPRQHNVSTLRDSLHGADIRRPNSARWWNDIAM